jgi:multidrug resistance efflux pump
MKKNDKPVYKVVKNHEVPELSTIKKSNITVEITLADTLKAIEQNNKSIESLKAEMNIKEALKINVKNNYPEAFDVDPKIRIAVHLLQDADKFLDQANKVMVQLEDANKELEAEVAEIKEQTGLAKMSTEEKIELAKKVNG